MKAMIKFTSIFILFIMVGACATTSISIPEKYNLDNELKVVEQITTFKKPDWEEVDNQSIILKTNFKDFYLLVLNRPITTMLPITIGISSTVSTIRAGLDQIVVIDSGIAQYYTIEKIYKLKGREQANEIKERFEKK